MKSKNKPLEHVAEETPLWSDKKRPFFGLPLSFTRYTLYPDRIIIERGFLFRHHDEIRLYRISSSEYLKSRRSNSAGFLFACLAAHDSNVL